MNHCSNCGERIVGEQQFCRSCGVELFIDGGWRGFNARYLIYLGLFLTLTGGLITLLGKFMESRTTAFAGTVFAMISFGMMLFGAILADSSRRSRKKKVRSGQEQSRIEKAHTTNRLPPMPAGDHFPASVTEHTTTKLHRK